MAAMHLHGGFGDADIASNLLAKATVRDMNHDLALPGTERLEALAESRQGFFILTPGTITSEAGLDGIKKDLITEWLREELDGAAFHRLHRHGDVAVPGDEDDWEFSVCRGQITLKIKPTLSRQSDVEHQ